MKLFSALLFNEVTSFSKKDLKVLQKIINSSEGDNSQEGDSESSECLSTCFNNFLKTHEKRGTMNNNDVIKSDAFKKTNTFNNIK